VPRYLTALLDGHERDSTGVHIKMEDIFKIFSIKQGHFILQSGSHGDIWIELDKLFISPKIVQSLSKELSEIFEEFEIDFICGPLTGGAFLAQ
jgi:orotate phosphoribosyltransferase